MSKSCDFEIVSTPKTYPRLYYENLKLSCAWYWTSKYSVKTYETALSNNCCSITIHFMWTLLHNKLQ